VMDVQFTAYPKQTISAIKDCSKMDIIQLFTAPILTPLSLL
jgi:hypothetical protein